MKCGILLPVIAAVCVTSAATAADPSRSIPEAVDWLEVRVNAADDHKLPRVLLVGDSITGGYFPGVANELKGRANVARFATSRGLGDPALFRELALVLDQYRFAVIHFNNGLHGWAYTEDDYRAAFPKLLQLLKEHAPDAKLIWASTTPHRMGAPKFEQFDPKNKRIQARNRIAAEIVASAGIPVNDLYALEENHPEHMTDGCHYKPEAAAAQAKQVARCIHEALPDSSAANDPAFERLRDNRLSWVSSAPLPFPEVAEPGVRHIAYKDPSVVRAKDAWRVYASKVRHLSNGVTRYSLAYLGFPDWDSAGKARVWPLLTDEELACAPHVFYYTPKKQWYVFYVWNDARTGYNGPAFSTLADVDRPETISPPRPCFPKIPDSLPGKKHWLDFTVIADSGKAYLFFTNDEGDLLRCHTALDTFPLGWSDPVVLLSAPISVIFEGSQTYKIKDRSEYLTIVEAIGPAGRRYYNSYLADRLDGEWRATGSTFEHPFAGCKNVEYPTGGEPWSVNISHGELIRASNDETMLVDLNRLEFLYQGWDRKTRIPGVALGRFNGYHETPWQLGLLRATAPLANKPGSAKGGKQP